MVNAFNQLHVFNYCLCIAIGIARNEDWDGLKGWNKTHRRHEDGNEKGMSPQLTRGSVECSELRSGVWGRAPARSELDSLVIVRKQMVTVIPLIFMCSFIAESV